MTRPLSRHAHILATVALLSLASCGGGDETAQPVLSATGTVSAAGHNVVVAYGASRVRPSGTVDIVVSDAPMNCATFTAMKAPPDGTYVDVQIPSVEKGVASRDFVDFTMVSGNGSDSHGGGSDTGTVEVLDVSDSAITIRVTYQDTLSDGDYAINGDFSVVRCP